MSKYNAKQIANELLKGKGYFVVENLFSKKDVKKAKDKIVELAKISAPDIAKKDALSVISATNHVWNLIDKDDSLPIEDKERALELLKMDMTEMQEVSKRWASDMQSDSWLSKNTRTQSRQQDSDGTAILKSI